LITSFFAFSIFGICRLGAVGRRLDPREIAACLGAAAGAFAAAGFASVF
jgi:hypothetical protein